VRKPNEYFAGRGTKKRKRGPTTSPLACLRKKREGGETSFHEGKKRGKSPSVTKSSEER